MGSYIDIIWTDEPPTPERMGWANTCFLISGARDSDATSNPMLVTSENYSDYLSNHDETCLSSYYAQGTLSNDTYVYWMESGTEETGIFNIEESDDLDPLNFDDGPFSAIGGVFVDPTGGSNWQEIDAYDETETSSGYVWETGNAGQYKQEITFEKDGPYFTSGDGDTLYTGSEAIDILVESGGRFKLEAEGNKFAKAKKDLAEYNIQLIVPVYDVSGTTGITSDYCHDDLSNAIDMVQGNQRRVIWSLPREAKPDDVFPGTDRTYSEFKDYIGHSEYASVVAAKVSLDANNQINDHPAGVIAGKAASLHPHENLTLKPVDVSLSKDGEYKENDSIKRAWDSAGIMCFFKQKDFGFDSPQINYGFTLSSTSPTNRLNNVRCRDLVYYNIYQDLWSLLSSDPAPRVSKSGLRRVIRTIIGTQRSLRDQGIIDGVGSVKIPLLDSGTDEQWATARSTLRVPAVEVTWKWRNSIEYIRITSFGEMG